MVGNHKAGLDPPYNNYNYSTVDWGLFLLCPVGAPANYSQPNLPFGTFFCRLPLSHASARERMLHNHKSYRLS
jgi:hypothetical protein